MLITKDYLKLNAELHKTHLLYGGGGWQWVGPILHYMRKAGDSETLLDYGCGKASLAEWFPGKVENYDPVTFPAEPVPSDFVACIDVLEHIEPECLRTVLGHIKSKMLKGGLLVISTRLAQKVLSDGRNAHLIVGDETFWDPILKDFFSVCEKVPCGRLDELVRFVRP